jgi:hypothetical protein
LLCDSSSCGCRFLRIANLQNIVPRNLAVQLAL